MLVALICLLPSTLSLPANTGYVLGDDASLQSDGTIGDWTHNATHLLWGGYAVNPGNLNVVLRLRSQADGVRYRLNVDGVNRTGKSMNSSVDFGSMDVKHPEWLKLSVSGDDRDGTNYGAVISLDLSGDAAQQAKFNLKERRNAASVHLIFPTDKSAPIEWFYNEIRPKADPINTYYMACGFNRGYFGIQVNGVTERRVIFSVWDAGKEAVDRSKVADDNRVVLLAKGDGVDAGSFGNEGTGGHSHLVYNWKTSEVQRFLLHAQPSGETTTYTAYYYFNDRKAWGLIASFRAPKDGHYLGGLYSFIEDFWGDNGYLLRKAEFGPAWIKPHDGAWQSLSTAKFSHDGTGGKDRFDYDMTSTRFGWLLQNGGFTGSMPQYGTQFTIQGSPSQPSIDFDHLPTH